MVTSHRRCLLFFVTLRRNNRLNNVTRFAINNKIRQLQENEYGLLTGDKSPKMVVIVI